MKQEQKKHSPGPWRIKDTDEEGHYLIESEDGSTCIAYGAGFYGKENPSMENARLICSAPDLLEALEGLVKLTRHVIAHHQSGAILKAEAAIRKATPS